MALINLGRLRAAPRYGRGHLVVYGISVEDWARLYESQAGHCPGCRAHLTLDRKTHVDHCHRTGQVRGLLCNNCNLAIGNAVDSAETLRRLAGYLDLAHHVHPT